MIFRKRADVVPLPIPRPQVLAPSGTFEGDDGKWATFSINIAGDGEGQGQNFHVLISTSSPMTLVPAQSGWCDSDDCAKNRGIMGSVNGQPARGFNDQSTAWNREGLYELPLGKPYWFSDTLLLPNKNNSLRGEWGTTTVGLGLASRSSYTLPDQYVAIHYTENLYLGSLGLAVGDVGFGSAEKPTFLSALASHVDLIPSYSYGFTAGASYRNGNKGVLGNMVFGGYDRARLVPQTNATISMPNQHNNTLVVGVQSIIYKPDQDVQQGSDSLTKTGNGGFNAVIDSTFPYLVLPGDICDQLVQKFNLGFDSATSLYTINSTAHEKNMQQNATLQIKIGTGIQDSLSATTIVLPYDALYLQASFPIYPTGNTTAYFPLKKSANGVNILGRTFLQEAYIIVDYERTTFTVAPAFFSDPMPVNEDLVPIYSTTYKPNQSNRDTGGGGLAAGAIAGIVVGIVAVFLLLGGLGFWFFKKRRAASGQKSEHGEKPEHIDTTAASGQIKHRRVSELTGSEPPNSPQTKPVGYYGCEHKSIHELPDSPPAELYSPPADGSETLDYFASGPKPRRRGATRDSPGQITPVAELQGDDGTYAPPTERPKHSRGPSDTSLSTNIDEVLAAPTQNTSQVERRRSSRFVEHTDGPSRAEMVVSPLENTRPDEREASTRDRPPSHTRGLSDTTVASDETAVSHFTPEELAQMSEGTGGALTPPHVG